MFRNRLAAIIASAVALVAPLAHGATPLEMYKLVVTPIAPNGAVLRFDEWASDADSKRPHLKISADVAAHDKPVVVLTLASQNHAKRYELCHRGTWVVDGAQIELPEVDYRVASIGGRYDESIYFRVDVSTLATLSTAESIVATVCGDVVDFNTVETNAIDDALSAVLKYADPARIDPSSTTSARKAVESDEQRRERSAREDAERNGNPTCELTRWRTS